MSISDQQWLEMADRFVLAPYGPRGIGMSYAIEAREQRDGSIKWAITVGQRQVVAKDLLMYHEPMPSSRDDEYLAETRFETKEEAYETWLKYKETDEYKMFQKMYGHEQEGGSIRTTED